MTLRSASKLFRKIVMAANSALSSTYLLISEKRR